MFDNILKKLTVNFTKKAYELKLTENKKINLCHGKITRKVACAQHFTINGSTLTYTPVFSENLDKVENAFKEILDDNT